MATAAEKMWLYELWKYIRFARTRFVLYTHRTNKINFKNVQVTYGPALTILKCGSQGFISLQFSLLLNSVPFKS